MIGLVARPDGTHLAIDPFLAIVRRLDLLDLGDNVFLFLLRPRSDVRLGQDPVDPLYIPQAWLLSLLGLQPIAVLTTHLAIIMHRLPMDDVPITPLFLEIRRVARTLERGFPEASMLLRRPRFEGHFECPEVLRVRRFSTAEVARGKREVVMGQ